MTSLVGILCRDGIVIGADSSATFTSGGIRTIEVKTEKITIVHDNIIVAGTGAVGQGQRFCAVVETLSQSNDFATIPALSIAKSLCKNAIDDFNSTHAQNGRYGALVAYPSNNGPILCEFEVDGFQPELKDDRCWYVSMGSAQSITDPFLALIRDIFWGDGRPSVIEAIFAVTWTLDHAVDVNPGGVNGPVRIAVLSQKPDGSSHAEILPDTELYERRQHIAEAKIDLRKALARNTKINNAQIPEIPKPMLQ